MSTRLDVAKQLTAAWGQKDEAGFLACVHEDYTFQGPMMKLGSAEEAVQCMKQCDFVATTENCEVIEEGHTLVHIFDWKVTAPFHASIPMIEVLEFEGKKVKRARLFFDTALFPAEIKDRMLAGTAA